MTPFLFAALASVGVGVVLWALLAPPAKAAVVEDAELPEGVLPSEMLGAARVRFHLREALATPIQNAAKPLLRGRQGQLQAELQHADLDLRAAEFVLIQVGVAILLGLVATLRFGNLFAVIAAVALGYFLPPIYLRRRKAKRRQAFEQVLGDTITILSNSVKAGYSIQQAMSSIAENGRPPLAAEIGRVVRETGLGIELEVALDHANQRLASQDFELLVTALLIHRTVGGNLAEVLDQIADTIRERVKVHGEVQVLTAQARASGYIITGLPFAVGVILSLISPSFERPLFTTPLGWVLLTVGMISISIGYAIIRKITDIHL
jgi:tight adherence protein B